MLFACDSKKEQNPQQKFNEKIKDFRFLEYKDCISSAQQEFKQMKISDIEKTCSCAADYIWDIDGIRTQKEKEIFAKDFRQALKNKCGKNIPSKTLKGIPGKQ